MGSPIASRTDSHAGRSIHRLLTAPPPVASLLEVDFYKFTMGQFAFRRHRDLPVRYRLICRTPGAGLARLVPVEALREALAEVRGLSFSAAELDWLRNTPPAGRFGEDYLGFLAGLRLPPVEVEARGGDFRLEVEDRWPETILWETLILSVLTELAARAELGGAGAVREAEFVGRERLRAKIEALRRRPEIRFASFGTRRRLSRRWQFEVEERLADALPEQFFGASCAESARRHGLVPVGTIAHEVFMVGAALGEREAVAASPNRMMDAWWDLYGEPLSVFLTDTFGSEAWFAALGRDRARRFRGVRHDSGDPAAYGERVVRWYRGQGLDPREKTLVFSDGLDLPAILDLDERFRGQIRTAYGWGTNLTHDCGLPNYPVVVKPVAANGRPIVKLSDDPEKSTGDPEEVARYRRIFRAPARRS